MANVVADGGRHIAVLPSDARTAAPDTKEYRGLGRAVGIVVVVDVTATDATPALTVKVQGVDIVSGKTWDILTSAALSSAATTVLRVRPGIAAVSNVSAADVLPPAVRITCLHGDADSITYSVNAFLVN